MARRYRKKRNRTARKVMGILLLCLLSALVGFYGVKTIMTRGQEPEEAVLPQEDEEISFAPMDGISSGEETAAPVGEPVEETTVPPGDDSTGREPEAPEKTESVLSLETEVYAYQLGSFSTRANAERFVGLLESKGATGRVMEQDGFKVVHRLYRNGALDGLYETEAKTLVGEAFKTVWKTRQTAAVPLGDAPKVEGWLKDFETVFDSIAGLEKAYADRESGSLSEQGLSEILEGFRQSLEQSRSRIENEESGEPEAARLKAFYEACASVVSEGSAEGRAPREGLSEMYALGLHCLEGGE